MSSGSAPSRHAGIIKSCVLLDFAASNIQEQERLQGETAGLAAKSAENVPEEAPNLVGETGLAVVFY